MAQQALLIAIAQYEDPRLSQLRTPAHDLSALTKVLADPAIGNFVVRSPLVNVPTHEMNRTLARFLRGAGLDDTLLVYIACHGLRDVDGQLYLAAVDTDSAELAVTGLSAEVVCGMLRRSPAARAVLILDCCFSGAGAATMLPDAAPGVDLGQFISGQGIGRVVITATSAEEYAWERSVDPFRSFEGNGGSVFCDALLDGLRTGAADLDGDGEISIGELYEYLLRRMATSDRHQTPCIWSHVRGRFVVAHAVSGVREAPPPRLPSTRSNAPWDAAALDWSRTITRELRDQLRNPQPTRAEAQGWRALHLADWPAARAAFGNAIMARDSSLSTFWGHAHAHAASQDWVTAGSSFSGAAEAAAVAASTLDAAEPDRRQLLMELFAGASLLGAACLAAVSDPRAHEVLDRGLRLAPTCPELQAYRGILARDDHQLGIALVNWPGLLTELRVHQVDVAMAIREALDIGEGRADTMFRARRRIDDAGAALGFPGPPAAPTAIPEGLPPDVRLRLYRTLVRDQRQILAEEIARLDGIISDLLQTSVDQEKLDMIGSTRGVIREAYQALRLTDEPRMIRARGIPPVR